MLAADTPDEEAPLAKALARSCDTLAENRVPDEVQVWLLSAPLPLRKPDEGVRPIVVSEILVRLTAGMLLSRKITAAQNTLMPNQLGVSVPNGAIAIAFVIRQLKRRYGHRDDIAIFQIDFKISFNLLNCELIFRTACAHYPTMYNFVRMFYPQHPKCEPCCSFVKDKPSRQYTVCGKAYHNPRSYSRRCSTTFSRI